MTLETKNLDSYYIYTYHDPLSGDVIYVGKGKGKRMYQRLTRSSMIDCKRLSKPD
jgi:hypothetical protein